MGRKFSAHFSLSLLNRNRFKYRCISFGVAHYWVWGLFPQSFFLRKNPKNRINTKMENIFIPKPLRV